MAKRGGWILAETLSWMAAASVILCGVGVFIALGNDPEHWEQRIRRQLKGGPQIIELAPDQPEPVESLAKDDSTEPIEVGGGPSLFDLLPRP